MGPGRSLLLWFKNILNHTKNNANAVFGNLKGWSSRFNWAARAVAFDANGKRLRLPNAPPN
jgi:hypothetical protein